MPRRRPIDDQAVESILGGTTTGDDLDGLRAFVVDVRAAAAGPMPAPSPALGHVLTRGFSTDKGDLPATAASNADGPAEQAAGLPKWRSAQMKVSRYIAGLSIAAKIALGAGAVFAATATAGATGVLPGPVQEAVDAVTPFGGGGDGAPGALPPSTTTGDEQHDGSTPADGTPSGSNGSTGTGGTGTTGSGTTGGGSTGTGTGTEPAHDTPAPTTVPTPTTVPAVVPPPGDSPAGDPPAETPVAQSMEIHCSLNDAHTAVSCEWSSAPADGFGTYVLLRTSDDGKPGRVLTQTGDITARTWTDALGLTPGVTYSYMVDSIGPDGKTTGHSNRVSVTF